MHDHFPINRRPSSTEPGFLRRLILLFGLIAVWAAPVPAGTLSPRHLLLQHYEALGGYDRVRAERTSHMAGRIVHDHLEGRIRQWEEIPLKYAVLEDYTVLQQAYGDDGIRSWSRDANGKVIVHRDEETLKRRQVKKLLQEFVHMDPDSPIFQLSYQGVETVEETACHVVRTTNRINSDISLDYIDTQSFLLVKSVLQQPDQAFHTLYSDYRVVNGILRPFREETRILPKDKKIIVEIDSFDSHIDIEPSRFAVPAADATDFTFAADRRSEDIPIEVVENNLFIPVTIAGDTRLWLLDSGATMTVIDRAYAGQLNLAILKGIRGSGLDGVFHLDITTLPGFQVPGIRFDPQKAFCLEGLADRFHPLTIGGIMGFDLLSRFVTRIDYALETMSFYHPEKFVYSGPGSVIDAPLKDKTFNLPMTVEGRYRGRWALDLGAYDVSFHFPYADSHALHRRKGVERISSDLSGVFRERVVRFQFVELGGFRVDDVLISLPERVGMGANAGRELIGNIGNSLLRRFVLILDYSRQQVIVEKGRDFGRRFPRDGSGMVIGLTETRRPMIAFVAPGTPGARAGFLAGDVIKTIGGIDRTELTVAFIRNTLLTSPPGTRYRIEVARKDRTVRLTLILDELY